MEDMVLNGVNKAFISQPENIQRYPEGSWEDFQSKIKKKLSEKDIENIKTNAEYYKSLVNAENALFAPLTTSTLTIKGKVNSYINEETMSESFHTPTGNIIKICNNFIELINPNYVAPKKKEKSTRGRKAKDKKKNKRKTQGSGKYFGSQTTFCIKNGNMDIKDKDGNPKQYKIKLFRNGKFQIPGIKFLDMRDVKEPLKDLCDYLSIFHNKKVKVESISIVMANFITKLKKENCRLKLMNLCMAMIEWKNKQKKINEINMYNDLKSIFGFTSYSASKMVEYLPDTSINIAEINFNPDQYFGLIIRFNRNSVLNNEEENKKRSKKIKKITIKILRSGKINFDGGNSFEEVEELYYWLQYILLELHRKGEHYFMYDPDNRENAEKEEKSDSDSLPSDCESIYDSFSE